MRGRKKKVLSINEIEDLKSEKQEFQSTLNAIENEKYGQGTAASNIDKSYIKRQIDKIDNAIHEGQPDKVRGANKDRMYQEAKELESKIQDGMPTVNEMERPSKHPGAIRKNQLWEKRNAGNIDRWKQIQRTLQPEDPTISNVERLRRS